MDASLDTDKGVFQINSTQVARQRYQICLMFMTIQVTSQSHLKSYFEDLNRIWLEEHFEVEPADRIVFENPESSIIEPGGEIFFILENRIPMGTCALVPVSVNELELSKMAVAPGYRCRGYGSQLMEAAVNFSHDAQARKISLITDTKLPEAIRLYNRYGFKMVPYTPDSRYIRGNVRMELDLIDS